MTRNAKSGPRPEVTKALVASQRKSHIAPTGKPHKSNGSPRKGVPIGPELLNLGSILDGKTLRRLPEAAEIFNMSAQEFAEAALSTWIAAAEAEPVVEAIIGLSPEEKYATTGADRLVSRLIREACSTADPDARQYMLDSVHSLVSFHPSYHAEAVLLRKIIDATATLGGGGGLIERANQHGPSEGMELECLRA